MHMLLSSNHQGLPHYTCVQQKTSNTRDFFSVFFSSVKIFSLFCEFILVLLDRPGPTIVSCDSSSLPPFQVLIFILIILLRT